MNKFIDELRRRNVFRVAGVLDYWHEYGFPPQCRPIGSDDFECD